MSGKGAHINVLGERIRRYYEHLMTDAHAFVDELRKDLEGPHAHGTATDQAVKPQGTSPPTASHPAKQPH